MLFINNRKFNENEKIVSLKYTHCNIKDIQNKNISICILLFNNDIFGAKFTKYLWETYPEVKLTLVVGQGRGVETLKVSKQLLQNLDRLELYNEDIERKIIYNKCFDLFFLIGDNFTRKIQFDVPKDIELKFFNKLSNNFYKINEYDFGMNKSIDNQMSLIINNYPHNNQLTEPVSLCLINTDKDFLEKECSVNKNSYGHQINVKNKGRLAMFDLVIQLSNYLSDIGKYNFQMGTEVKILYPKNTLQNLYEFFNSSEFAKFDGRYFQTFELLSKYGIEYDFSTATNTKMFFEQTIPIAFLNSEQSVTEFLFSREDLYCDLHVQIMNKDIDFYKNILDVNNYTSCGTIDKNTLLQFRMSKYEFYPELKLLMSAIQEAATVTDTNYNQQQTTIIIMGSITLGLVICILLVVLYFCFNKK